MGVVYFVTGNKNKFAEAQKIIPTLERIDIDLDEIQETDPRKIIEAKIKSVFKHKEAKFVVDDVSVYMECLGGKLPGPLIKWFLTSLGNKGLYEIAKRFNNFNAEVRATVAYAESENEIHFFEGTVKGTIVNPVQSGFGWDPLFKPDGFAKTYAEMTVEEKNEISHRGIAFRKLRDFLDNKIAKSN
jgi:non-canonical purine NTP pyrophosphatase (RdgB/HAM1 family)